MYCRNCGKKFGEDSKYCSYCGTAQHFKVSIESANSDSQNEKVVHNFSILGLILAILVWPVVYWVVGDNHNWSTPLVCLLLGVFIYFWTVVLLGNKHLVTTQVENED